MTIDRTNAKLIISEVISALKDIENKYNVKITQKGGATYTPDMLNLKLEINTIKSDGTVYNNEAEVYKARAEWYGLENIPVGSIFDYNGNKYKVMGLKPRCKKQPVICQQLNDNTRKYKFSVNTVKRLVI